MNTLHTYNKVDSDVEKKILYDEVDNGWKPPWDLWWDLKKQKRYVASKEIQQASKDMYEDTKPGPVLTRKMGRFPNSQTGVIFPNYPMREKLWFYVLIVEGQVVHETDRRETARKYIDRHPTDNFWLQMNIPDGDNYKMILIPLPEGYFNDSMQYDLQDEAVQSEVYSINKL